MSEPKIAAKFPAAVTLKPGKYHWCACGQSKNQPFCDGSHKETNFEPVKFVAEEKAMVAFCGCKRSKFQPFCDDSHISIKVEPKEIDESKKPRLF